MRRTNLLLVGMVFGLALPRCVTAGDHPGLMIEFKLELGNGLTLTVDQVAEPAVQWQIDSRMFPTADGKIHRVLKDDTREIYFGYDVRAEPVSGGRIRVWIEPLSLTVDDLNQRTNGAGKGFGALRYVILPRYPEPQIIQRGDTIELDLLTTPFGKQKVVDYLDISDSPSHN